MSQHNLLVSFSPDQHALPSIKDHSEFVTMRIAGQLFGISVLTIQDVLRGLKMTRIPLAPSHVAGSLNLRGRIVTAIDMRESLELPKNNAIIPPEKIMSVVVHYKDELFSLIVDAVGEVINLPTQQMEKTPANLSSRWQEVAQGVYRLQGELLVIIDIQKLLKF